MPFLAAIATVVAFVWALLLIPRISLLVLAAVYLIAASLVGYDIWHFEVGMSMSVDRIILIVLVGCFAIHWLRNLTAHRDIPASEGLLLAFCGLLVVNTFVHQWRRDAPDQIPIVQHLIEGYVVPLILYWIARRSQINQRVVDWFYALFAILGIYLAFTAVCECVGAWSLVFPRKIADPMAGIHFGRARGPFLQSVRLGLYLLTTFGVVWVALIWQACWGRRGQLLGIALTPLFVAAIAGTLTRSIWLGFGLASVVLLVLTTGGRLRRGLLVGGVLTAMLLAGLAVDGRFQFKRESNAQDTEQSTNMRAVFAYVSYLMIKDRPISGFGFGHFPHEKSPYLNDRSTTLRMETIRTFIHHNTFLSIFVELGAGGFLLIVAVLATWGRRAYRLWNDHAAPVWMRRHALLFLLLLTAYPIQMLFHEVSYSTVENGLLFLMAGLMSGMASMQQHCPAMDRRLASFTPNHWMGGWSAS